MLYTDGFYPVKTFCYYYFYINNNNNINIIIINNNNNINIIIIIIIIIIIHTPKPFCVRVMGNRSFSQFGPEGRCLFLVQWHILFSITFQSPKELFLFHTKESVLLILSNSFRVPSNFHRLSRNPLPDLLHN